ncbi:MAG: tRNA-dependent cyclodipeptide synthase [Endomicrobium sp.]|nr:tRNA-dependent cyclodipeptide synthase [Endomicrobium sp.]
MKKLFDFKSFLKGWFIINKNVTSIKFVNSESEKIFNLKEHALFGISPFNSYYSEDNLKKLFSWALNNFKKISVCIPDGASTYTLQAIGYPKDKADRKTKRHDNNLRNKTINALVANNLSEDEAKSKMVFFTDLAQNNKKYLEFCKLYEQMYENDKNFREGCLLTSKHVLSAKGNSACVDERALNFAVKYFLAELPLYLNTPDILNVSSSLFVYKDLPTDFLNKIYNNGPFSSLLSLKQGCLAIQFD